jgi:hypothetical protein
MVLPVLIRRHWLEARDDIRFPDGKAANALRGGFGNALRAGASPEVYRQIFEPRLPGSGPSGLADPPRPFVFRAAHLDGVEVGRHDDFYFDVHIFGEPGIATAITSAIESLFESGAAVGRSKAKLVAVADRDVPISLESAGSAQSVRVKFLTPTELKHEGRPWIQPDFSVLIRRIRDRVATLMSLYGPGSPPLDLQLFAQIAPLVRTVRADIDLREVVRTSGRTGQTHPIGGMVGEADYAGPLDAFLPYLHAAFYTGVGRHTVWGNGCIETEILDR